MGDALSELSDIYDTHAPRVYRYIYRRLGDQSLAEDLTGEVFVRFLHVNTTPDNIAAFLYRIAHNLIVDYLRHNPPARAIGDDVPVDHADPAHLAELDMERARLRRLIARLTPDQQQVIVLKFLEGLSNEEIAHVLDKPIGAVKALQHRGLVALRGLLSTEARRDQAVEHLGKAR